MGARTSPRIDRRVVFPLPDGPVDHEDLAATHFEVGRMKGTHRQSSVAKNLGDTARFEDRSRHG